MAPGQEAAQGEFTPSPSSHVEGPSDRAPGGRAKAFLDAAIAFVLDYILHPLLRLALSLLRRFRRQDRSHAGTEHDPEKMQHAVPSIPSNSATTATTAATNSTNTATMNGHARNGVLSPVGSNAPSSLKENLHPTAATTANGHLANGMSNLTLENGDRREEGQGEGEVTSPATSPAPLPVKDEEPEDPVKAAERQIHHGFMNQALDMARLALKTNETPVGCVLVHNGRVIAKGMNATNVTRNGTRHAELMALTALLSHTSKADSEKEVPKKSSRKSKKRSGSRASLNSQQSSASTATFTEQEWGDVDPKDGHIYPYGQKLHPAPIVDKALIKECTLYVTVEPCVMCASMLRQLSIRKVYFGAVNDKFGGTGGVFCIHINSTPADQEPPSPYPPTRPSAAQILRPVLSPKPASPAIPTTPQTNGNGESSAADNNSEAKETNGQEVNGKKPSVPIVIPPPPPVSKTGVGHGGNVEDGFEAEGGWGRDEAVNLLRQFYVQENGRAPQPRKKEGRAARLAAMMESQGMSTEGTALEGLASTETDDDAANAETPSETPLEKPATPVVKEEDSRGAAVPPIVPKEVMV